MKTILLVGLFAIAFAQADEPSTSYVKGITPGRARALVGVAIGIASVLISRRAKNRPTERRLGIIAIAVGLIAVIINVLHLANTSGFGTGGGKAGAIVGILLGIIGLAVIGAARMRMRKDS